jgi:hypothetical protein
MSALPGVFVLLYGMKIKQCTKCGETKPLTEYSICGKSKAGSLWHRGVCKDCYKAVSAEWRNDNPEYHAKYNKENYPKIKAKAIKWRKENPEKAKAKSAKQWTKTIDEYGEKYGTFQDRLSSGKTGDALYHPHKVKGEHYEL